MTSTADTAAGTTTRSVSWASFNKPVHVTAHDRLAATDLVYGPGRGRIKQTVVKGSEITTITYLGGLYEKEEARYGVWSTPDKLKHYIRAGGTVAIYTQFDGLPAKNKTRYLHKDHLGSIDLITDEQGDVVERRSHDAHGKLRQADWQAATGTIAMIETPRGFTGHEHLDSVGLIHMNGRVYDPEIGRFLSADPFVQASDAAQAFNRYSYVNNNPLSFTDPSGFFAGKIRRFFESAPSSAVSNTRNMFIQSFSPSLSAREDATRALLQDEHQQLAGYIGVAVVGVYCAPCGVAGAAAWSAAIAWANGANGTTIAKSAAIAGGVAAASAGVGAAAGAAANAAGSMVAGQIAVVAAKVVAQGVVSGAASRLQGGSFARGFVVGAISAAGSAAVNAIPGTSPGMGAARVALAAVVGGATAELGGGKFINGAMSAAFMQMTYEIAASNQREAAEAAEAAETVDVEAGKQVANRSSGSLGAFFRDALGRLRPGVSNTQSPMAGREAQTFAKPSTLKPGPHAKESIPGHNGRPTAAEQRQVNELMNKNGCHTCGTKNPGTNTGNAVVDHQPARALGNTERFFPHCIECMRRQGGEVLQELIRRGL